MNRPICHKCGKVMTRGPKTPGGKIRWLCREGSGERKFCSSTTNAATDPANRKRENSKPLKFKRNFARDSKVFIITAAQNATPVHKDFWQCLLQAKDAMRAELVVGPIRYKNPTSKWTSSQANEEIWAPEVVPYLVNERVRLNANLVFLGDIKIQPTASEPLTGLESITGCESTIALHTKVQLKTVATPSNKMAKLMATTGACTVANYTDSRVGKLGEFHHSLSAVVVEISGKIFHARHVHFDTKTKSFIDLRTEFRTDKVVGAPRPLALVMGDTHVDFIDPKVDVATREMISSLQPENLVFHDLLDGYACNGHHIGNPFNAYAKRHAGRDNVQAEVARAIDFVKDITPKNTNAIVVASNHDDFLRRWVVSTDWRSDPTNAMFYLKTAQAMLTSTKLGPGGTEYQSPFPYWFNLGTMDRPLLRCLNGSESFVLAGVELSMHGDKGPNGSRGSARNLRRIGVKSIIGHSHSPQISEGCYQVGTSSVLNPEYVSGPSSWLQCHCVLHKSGKRQLVFIIDGKWRGN